MSDSRLEKLGQYFVRFAVRKRYGITFEQFVRKVELGTWDAYLAGEAR